MTSMQRAKKILAGLLLLLCSGLMVYDPENVSTAWLLEYLQGAGSIRELTAQGQNIDQLIAQMYREMDL